MHQIPAFELAANAQRHFQLSQKSKQTIFKKFVALPGTRTREPESSQQKSKSVARYPLGYWDINNWCWIFSLVIKLVCISHYRHFVFSTWKVHCAVVLCAPLWLGLHYWQWEMYTVTRHTRKFYFILIILFSGLSLVLNKEGLWLTKTDTQPERTQRWATWQARLDTHLL